MNKLIAFFVLLLNIACATDSTQSHKTALISKNVIPEMVYTVNFPDEPYNLKIDVEETELNEYNLVISIDLYNGAHFISPHEKSDFKGKFFMDLGSYKNIGFEGDVIETPRSVEEEDLHFFTNRTVNWVRVNTIYKQPLQINTQEDFEVFGRVMFTIEPRCTLENIPFVISYKDGEMTVKKNPKC